MYLDNYLNAILFDRPVFYGPLWGNAGARDLARKSPDGTFTGSPTRGVRGPLGDQGIDFAVGTQLDFPDANFLDLGDIWAIETWFSLDNISGLFSFVTKFNGAYSIDWWNGVSAVRAEAYSAADLARSATLNTINKWYHVVATKNGATTKIYINSQDQTVPVGNTTTINTPNFLSLGVSIAGAMTSKMAHTAVYNYPLSRPQILNHYRAGIGQAAGGNNKRHR